MRVTTTTGGIALHQHGEDGPVVLLLHPLALSGRFWGGFAKRLAASARVLAWDARGHGESSWDGAPFSIEDMADDAAQVLREVAGGEPAAVLGMSMGGCTAIALAQRHPELVRSLVLADTTACYGEGRQATWEERAQAAETKPREALLEFQVTRWFSDAFRDQSPEEVQRVVDVFVATRPQVHAAASRAMGAFDAVEGLPAIAADTLVVVGEEDYATPPAMAQLLAERIPGARLEVLDRARHLSLLERPDRWDALARHLLPEGALA